RFGAELDAAAGAAMIRGAGCLALKGSVKQRAHVVAAHKTIGDGHVGGVAEEAETIGSLEHDRVIPRRIHADIRDAYVAAGVDVDPIAVGVDLDVVDGEVVNAGCENCEMAA